MLACLVYLTMEETGRKALSHAEEKSLLAIRCKVAKVNIRLSPVLAALHVLSAFQ